MPAEHERRVETEHASPRWDESDRREVRAVCLRNFVSARLPMQFVDVEVDAGRQTAVIFFMSETKVDFRDLSRNLGRDLRMRVTLHRLGPRDLARRAGTCGPCGRPLCCKSFLSGFPSVSVKLVKEQKFPLTPERSAGMCGRLKCCLAYERDRPGCPQPGQGCRGLREGTTDTHQDGSPVSAT